MYMMLKITKFVCDLEDVSYKFGRRIYRNTNSVSENKNENIELIVNNVDEIRAKIIEKFTLGRENQEYSTI